MQDVFVNTVLDVEDFKHRLIEICNQHRNQNRALAFMFILYDFHNPYIKRVLDHEDYWQSFNRQSGEYLTVYNFRYRRVPQNIRRNIRQQTQPHIFQTLNKTMDIILEYHFNGHNIKYPSLLFFQVDENEVIDQLIVDLQEQDEEKSFLEIQSYLEKAVDALKQIHKSNYNNRKEIFDCLEREVYNFHKMKKIKRGLDKTNWIIALISSIKGLWA